MSNVKKSTAKRTVAKEGIKEQLELPNNATAALTDQQLRLEGPKGTVIQTIPADMTCHVNGKTIILQTVLIRKLEKKTMYTTLAHLRNNIQGIMQGHCYRMKMCSGHFPMSAVVAGRELSVKNFLGEKLPRKFLLPEGVQAKVEGTEVVLTGSELQHVSQCAASIERLTRIPNRDRRIFQDGIFLIERNGVPVRAG